MDHRRLLTISAPPAPSPQGFHNLTTTFPGRLFLLATLTALALLLAPSIATTAGTIVLYGNQPGTHLDIAEEGGKIIVSGHMGDQEPAGCAENPAHTRAACPVAGAAAIQVVMGPGNAGSRARCRFPSPSTSAAAPTSSSATPRTTPATPVARAATAASAVPATMSASPASATATASAVPATTTVTPAQAATDAGEAPATTPA